MKKAILLGKVSQPRLSISGGDASRGESDGIKNTLQAYRSQGGGDHLINAVPGHEHSAKAEGRLTLLW
ncbi:Uncharacterised protein [Serratia fonticola]|uniref:Uncharacterized protein n=1 Tax=Serratia fonticola TaxID=47917 RepID=A0A4U9WE42_SERFO|nr:Uncharacterised protein [Serratia fonticola]